MRRCLSIVAFLALVAGLGGCAQQERGSPPIDERLLAALGLAQAYQHQSAELEAAGDAAGALAAARRVLEIPFPEGAPEREDVRLDAHGRIAELLLGGGDEAAAQAALERGLGEATRPSYFKAHLYAVEGRVHRARARRLREAGDEEGARQASRAAIASLERSIEINRAVLGLAGPRPDEGEDGGGALR